MSRRYSRRFRTYATGGQTRPPAMRRRARKEVTTSYHYQQILLIVSQAIDEYDKIISHLSSIEDAVKAGNKKIVAAVNVVNNFMDQNGVRQGRPEEVFEMMGGDPELGARLQSAYSHLVASPVNLQRAVDNIDDYLVKYVDPLDDYV